MTWEIALQLITLVFAIGVAVGLFRGKYLTKADLDKHKDECHNNLDKKFCEISDNRREIWSKIDQMHEWMITGVIVLNRKDRITK